MKRKAPAVCPVCGEDVPPRALACPECGACHETGWRDDAGYYDGLDLPDHAWEEEEGKKARVPLRRRETRAGVSPFWRVVAILTLLVTFWFLWNSIFAIGRARWW